MNEVADATGATRNDPRPSLASAAVLLRTAMLISTKLMPISREPLIQRESIPRNQYESTKIAFNTHI
jgi:hypothetical protein